MKSINKTPLQSYLLTKNPSLLPPEVPSFSFPLTVSSPTYVFQEFSAEDEVLVNDELIVLDSIPLHSSKIVNTNRIIGSGARELAFDELIVLGKLRIEGKLEILPT